MFEAVWAEVGLLAAEPALCILTTPLQFSALLLEDSPAQVAPLHIRRAKLVNY